MGVTLKFKMADREIEDAPENTSRRCGNISALKRLDNGVKSVNKTKTVCKVCQSDVSYTTGTTTNK